jgi:hypothetical protein
VAGHPVGPLAYTLGRVNSGAPSRLLRTQTTVRRWALLLSPGPSRYTAQLDVLPEDAAKPMVAELLVRCAQDRAKRHGLGHEVLSRRKDAHDASGWVSRRKEDAQVHAIGALALSCRRPQNRLVSGSQVKQLAHHGCGYLRRATLKCLAWDTFVRLHPQRTSAGMQHRRTRAREVAN